MSKIEQFNSMDGYTFDEGVAFLVLVKSPNGVINHLKATHNRNQLHSEIHRMLRLPVTKRLLKEKGYNQENKGNFPLTSREFPNEGTAESNTIGPKSNETGLKSNENKPEPDEDKSESNDTSNSNPARHSQSASDDLPDEDPTSIIITQLDVRQHKNTRYEDMPNDICRELWLKKNDLYHEMQQNHLKMRKVPVGEDHNDERAQYRAKVLQLSSEINKLWELIDAEIERFNADNERADKKADKEPQKPSFDVSTYRAYICRAIRKNSLTDAQRVELQHRVDAMLEAGVEITQATLDKLKTIGIKIG